MNNKGFTLMELLATIAIMGILMVIAITAVSRIVENARKDMYIKTAKVFISQSNLHFLSLLFSCFHVPGKLQRISCFSSSTSRNFYIVHCLYRC